MTPDTSDTSKSSASVLYFIGFILPFGSLLVLYNAIPGLADAISAPTFATLSVAISIVFAIIFRFLIGILMTLLTFCIIGALCIGGFTKCSEAIQKDGFKATSKKVFSAITNKETKGDSEALLPIPTPIPDPMPQNPVPANP